MPITHEILRSVRVVKSTHVGVVDDDEFLSSYRELFTGDAYELAFDRIIDLRRADSTRRSAIALKSVAALISRCYEGRDLAPKTAVIASADISFGLGRMFAAFAAMAPGEVEVFQTPDAALAWLGAPTDLIIE